MTRLRSPDLWRDGYIYAGSALIAVMIGVMIGRGHYYLAAGGALGAGAAIVFGIQALGFRALTSWIVVGVLAYPFIRYPYGHSQLTFDRIWLFGLAGAMLVAGPVEIRRSPASRRAAIWVFIFAAAMFLRALLTSPGRSFAIGLAVDGAVLPAILFFAARRMVVTRERWERLISAVNVAGGLLGLFALAERLGGIHLEKLSGGTVTVDPSVGTRVAGPYANDDVLALALLMCLAATIMWIQSDRRRLSVGLLVALLEVSGITLTFFRGAWIAALLVVVAGIGLRPRKHARLVATVGIVGVLVAVLYVRVGDAGGLSERVNNTSNVNGRVATWQQALELFRLHPLDGVGLGQFAHAQEAQLVVTEVNGVEAVATAHDSFLDALGEGGLLVSVPFLVLAISVAIMIHRFRKVATRDPYDVLIGAMIVGAALAYVLMSLEETVITAGTASNAFFALLLGACAARLDVVESEQPEEAAELPAAAALAAP
jgi:hypothetical protein